MSDVVFRCHCPRCQAIAEDTGVYDGWLSYHCHCGAVWRMPREWTKQIPFTESALYLTGRLDSVLDPRD